MIYREDGSAAFIGLERLIGRVGGRRGSFVLQHDGTYTDGVARGKLRVVSGSDTNGLTGMWGEGLFEAGHAENRPMTLDYRFE